MCGRRTLAWSRSHTCWCRVWSDRVSSSREVMLLQMAWIREHPSWLLRTACAVARIAVSTVQSDDCQDDCEFAQGFSEEVLLERLSHVPQACS